MPSIASPAYKILIDGSELPSEVEVDILSVTVNQYIKGADMFVIEVNIWDPGTQEFKWIDEDQFAVGHEIEIKIGYADNLKSMMQGEITALAPEYETEKAPQLKVQGYDRLHRFRRGTKTRSFIEMKDSQVAEQIARELNLQSQATDSQVIHPYLLQHNQTDIDFLLERAKRIHYEVDVTNRTLIFRPVANDRGKSITLKFGENLQTFYPRMTTHGQVSEIIVQGWNPNTKEAVVGRAGSGDHTSTMAGETVGAAVTEGAFGATKKFIVDKCLFNQAEAQQIAKAKYNNMLLNFINGEGTVIGEPEMIAGEVIELSGLGRRFNGLYYVVSVQHIVNPEGYVTHFCVERNAA